MANTAVKEIAKTIDKKEVLEVVNQIKSNDDWIGVAIDLCSFGYQYCEKIKEKSFEIYQNNVKPKLIRLEHIECKLKAGNFKNEEEENKLLSDLVIVEKEIKNEAKEYNNSIARDLAIGGGGVAIGVTLALVLVKIFGVKK